MTPEWLPTADQRTKWGSEYPRWPSNRTVVTHFGCWNAGLEAAGLATGAAPGIADRCSTRCATSPPSWVVPPTGRTSPVGPANGQRRRRSSFTSGPYTPAWPPPGSLLSHTLLEPGGDRRLLPGVRRRARPPTVQPEPEQGERRHPPEQRQRVPRLRNLARRAAAAGYSPRLQRWPAEDVIAALRQFARRHGRPPRVNELRSDSDPPPPAYSTIERRFGGFPQALSAAGLARTHGARRTRRTEQLLDAVAAHPGSSNRELAEACGITDSSHISILLRRLQKLGLIKNTGPGAPTPNSWSITRSGAAARWRFARDARGERT